MLYCNIQHHPLLFTNKSILAKSPLNPDFSGPCTGADPEYFQKGGCGPSYKREHLREKQMDRQVQISANIHRGLQHLKPNSQIN
jgi:hypothetical protein